MARHRTVETSCSEWITPMMESCLPKGKASTEEVAPKNMWGCLEGLAEEGKLYCLPKEVYEIQGKEGRKKG